MMSVDQTFTLNASGGLKWPSWLARLGLAVALAISLVGGISSTVSLATNQGRDAGESLGFFATPSPSLGSPWLELTSIHTGGPAAKAGLRPGDQIRLRQLMGEFIGWRPGDHVRLELARGNQRQSLELVAQHSRARIPGMAPIRIAMSIQPIFTLMLCGLMLLRARGNRAALLLTAILLSVYTDVPTPWLPHDVSSALLVLALPVVALAEPLWPVFCLEIARQPAAPRPGNWVYAVSAVIAVINTGMLVARYLPLGLSAPPEWAVTTLEFCWQAIGFGIMAFGYLRADAPTRNRIRIVAIAFVLLLIQYVFERVALGLLLGGRLTMEEIAPVALAMTASGYLALALLTYAMLRRTLFDIGFAINRTLVYGAVSFTLLAAFGLAEWGVDQVVPEDWHKGSAFYSAGIAVALFLSFHRLRDWFEKHVERLFFAQWHRAERELRRFVASAGHFRHAPVLCREFVREVEHFADGALAALYLRDDGSDFVRQSGSLAAEPRYAEEGRAFALLAAERAPVDLAEAHSALPAAIAFPMFDQLGLAGFVLVGARPDGAHYRPDEIENLAWATQQVGLDLQALQARELRVEVATLREQLAARRRRPPKLAAVSSSATA